MQQLKHIESTISHYVLGLLLGESIYDPSLLKLVLLRS